MTGGCATPVADRRKAKVFAERFNAEEFLRSLPKIMKNLGYYIASTEQMEPKPIMPDGIAPVMQTPSVQKPGLTEAEYYPPWFASAVSGR